MLRLALGDLQAGQLIYNLQHNQKTKSGKMKIKQSVVPILAWIAAIGFSNSGMAHHSAAPHFDSSKEVSFDNAEVVEWKFVNPHSYIYFDVASDTGEAERWRCEMSSATLLGHAGWSQESLLPGDKINIVGSPGRREANLCAMTSITFADGTEVGPIKDLRANQVGLEEVLQVESRPERLANGDPNISGAWITLSFGPGAKGGEPPPQLQGAPTWGGYELTEAGLAAAEAYDVRYDDPALGCHPINIIEGWNHDQHVNHIYQEEDKIILQYGYVDFVRTIHMNMEEHPEDITPSAGGHSIGRWVDDILVVDTIGFEPGLLLHQGGVSHTADMHVVERFYRDTQTNELIRNYRITDSAYFVGAREGVDYQAMSAAPYEPYNCTELGGQNNQRPE